MTKAEQLKKNKNLKDRVCSHSLCDNIYTPHNGKHLTCNWRCAIAYTKEKELKRKLKEANRSLKEFNQTDISWLKKNAQKAFNAFIRERDKHLPCISCNYFGNGRQFHAGHFKPVGSNGNLRYNEDNCHRQCQICNNHKSGNLILYERNLIERIGQERVDALDSKRVKTYSVLALQEVIKTYKQKLKDLG